MEKCSIQPVSRFRLSILGTIASLLVGCEAAPVREINPDPRIEYQLAQQEYNEALAYRAQAQSNIALGNLNESMGTWNGDAQSRAIGSLLGASSQVGAIDAQQKVDAAWARLQAAQAGLQRNYNINVNTNPPRTSY